MEIRGYDRWLENGATKEDERVEREYVVWGTIDAVTEARVYAESWEEAKELFIQGLRDGSIKVDIVDYDTASLEHDTIDGETLGW